MKRITTTLAALCMLVLLAVPAHAEHDSGLTFFSPGEGDRWNESGPETYCISGDYWDTLSNVKADGAAESIDEAVSRWESSTDINANQFSRQFGPPVDCGDFQFHTEYNNAGSTEAFCNQVPTSRPSSFQRDPMPSEFSSVLGVGMSCDRNDNGKIDYFVVNLNVNVSNVQWSFSGVPTSNEWDALGALMHELGHGVGWSRHLNGTFAQCNHNNSEFNTMCGVPFGAGDAWGFFERTASRNLEAHEISETNQVYPP